MADIDYYKILGVPKDATASQIKARYQLLAKKFHPDHDGDDSVMSLINEAYQVLSDTQKRYKYDHANDQPKSSSTNNTNRSYSQQTYTAPKQPKPNYQQPPKQQRQTDTQRKAAMASQARIKQLEWWIKYPYILPGLFGLFVIAAAWSSPYVSRTKWVVWTVILVAVSSYLYQQLLKASLRKVKERASASSNVNNNRNGTVGIVVTILVFVAIAVIASHHNASSSSNNGDSQNTSNTSDTTTAQAVVNSKNQYYNPTYATDYPASYEQYFSNNCMANEANQFPAFAQDTQPQQIRFCGCTLALLEQNYTYSQATALQQEVNSGTPATALDNLDIQDCSSV